MKVRTYRDLANLSADEIQAKLKSDKKLVAKFKIEAWIEQAEDLALEPKKQGDWEDYASFLVYFEAREVGGQVKKRIKVSHIEKDECEVWSKLTAEHFLWMLEQAGEGPFSKVTKTEPALKASDEATEAAVEVKQIRLYQPPGAKKPMTASNGKPKTEKLRAGKPFALEVSFSLCGEGAESVLKQGSEYLVRAVASETNTKAGIDLGGSMPEPLIKGTYDYSVRMPEMTLGTGLHRLWAVVSINAANTVPNFLEGPSVQVE